MRRPWRGATLEIEIARDAALDAGVVAVESSGGTLAGDTLTEVDPGEELRIHVRCG
jgi:hypothetical protein